MTGLDVIDYFGQQPKRTLSEEILGFDLIGTVDPAPQWIPRVYGRNLAEQFHDRVGVWPISAGLK